MTLTNVDLYSSTKRCGEEKHHRSVTANCMLQSTNINDPLFIPLRLPLAYFAFLSRVRLKKWK